MPGRVYTTAELLLGILLLAAPIARMASQPSTSKVSFSAEVDWCESERGHTAHYVDSDFEYVESTNEAASSGNEDDAEKLEAILGAVYTSSQVKESLLDPAERQSLLLFDKDFAVEEDLESGTPLLLLLFLHSPLYMYSVICCLPFTHSLFSLIVLYSSYSYMHFHYTFIQKTTVACSQICVLEVNVVQTARTLTPAQKTKNHHQKETIS